MAGCLDETKHRTNVLRQHDVLTEPVNGVAMFEAVFLEDYGSTGNPTRVSEGSLGPRGVAFP
jgi:hypothetical protein